MGCFMVGKQINKPCYQRAELINFKALRLIFEDAL